jgi:ABC-type glycerol-3-phosphate transport system substrate-binding protein
MEVVLGDFANSLSQVEDSVLVLNNMYRKVVQITGTVPDSYIDYEIDKKVPGFKDTMAEQAEILYAVVDELVEITGEKGSGAVQIEKVARECAAFAEKPDDVVDEISTFKSNISALGTWMLDISSMPLEVDSFTLSAPGAKLKSAEPNAVVAAYHEAIRFGATFFVDSTQIASDSDVSSDAIKVWIATGRDQAQIIRNLVDGDYSPSHEKSVNLQLIPSGVLLPATLSGNGPDVSLSNAQSSVVDFAVRGALADLSKMEGFDEYSKNFYDSAIQTASYNGGVYGLPETQSFSVLFYRSDILEELGLDVPKTWSDVENAINILHINNYDFYIPTSGIYTSLVYQYGGDVYLGAAGTTDPNTGYVYDASGSDYGIQSGLREEPAMLAFKKLTEFFTTYALPVSADFSNRFRTGEIPLGIADYTLFNTLEIFAPEIRGLWNFAPLPGYEREDGTVDNTSVSTSTHTVILDSSKKQEDAWEFVRWWLSEDVQVQYGNTLEAILGSGARYATANPKVLTQLPWATRQSDVILEQFENTKGIPDVPGYYMTSREIDYAFKDVVTDGQNPREALYLNVKEINDELTIKREEFHLTRLDEEGNVIDG